MTVLACFRVSYYNLQNYQQNARTFFTVLKNILRRSFLLVMLVTRLVMFAGEIADGLVIGLQGFMLFVGNVGNNFKNQFKNNL